ncbi:hypothetical protein GBA52_024549 [Prunus armeniaca]|nr:hypothetical protein GBA52_024549 [Prunus armeniaca]
MNTLMWKNRFMERHIMSTGELGVSLIPPVTRRLACGDYGNGAMAEPSLIYYANAFDIHVSLKAAVLFRYERDATIRAPWGNALEAFEASLEPFKTKVDLFLP